MNEEINKEKLSEFKKSILEECFILVYKTSMTLADVWNLPVSYRKWFINRIIQQHNAEQSKPALPPPISNPK